MSDEIPEATVAPERNDVNVAPSASSETPAPSETPNRNNPDNTESPSTPSPVGGAKKRRRRGSRGGRNRRKPAGTRTGEPRARVGEEAEDWNDAAADRGLTSESVAEEAREEAEVPATHPRPDALAPKPRIGDSRPALPKSAAKAESAEGAGGAAAGPAKTGTRRRRRGGRGRGKGGSGEGSGGTKTAANAVRADLGIGEIEGGLDDIDDDVLERRRGRTRKGRPAGRYFMCVHVRDDGNTHIAVLEGRNLTELYVSRPEDADTSIDGNIYLGRVQNVLPGMEAAFVDIGTPKNAVLYRGDVAFDPADVEESQPKIEKLLKNGQTIMVQVTKNPIGAKGARLTQEVSLAGRFVVMVPGEPQTYGISKRLPDEERKRLRKLLDGIRPTDAGLIVRTAAEGATADELERDLKRLSAQWQQISELASQSKGARLLYQEPQMVVRVIREEFTKEYRGVVIDNRELHDNIKDYVDAIAPELADRIECYDEVEENLPMFERFHVHEQLHKALDRKVWLPSGGSLIIERTEALTVIDVNTGKNVGKSNLEETVYRNNLEAAEEVARQLRLRDIGGIIVIDFVDMEIRKNREDVLRTFKDALARDKTRTQVFEISELGLVEMTRKRISEGLVEVFSETCVHCAGRGFVVDEALLD